MNANDISAWLNEHFIFPGNPSKRRGLAIRLEALETKQEDLDNLRVYCEEHAVKDGTEDSLMFAMLQQPAPQDMFSACRRWVEKQTAKNAGGLDNLHAHQGTVASSRRRSKCCDAIAKEMTGGGLTCMRCGEALGADQVIVSTY